MRHQHSLWWCLHFTTPTKPILNGNTSHLRTITVTKNNYQYVGFQNSVFSSMFYCCRQNSRRHCRLWFYVLASFHISSISPTSSSVIVHQKARGYSQSKSLLLSLYTFSSSKPNIKYQISNTFLVNNQATHMLLMPLWSVA